MGSAVVLPLYLLLPLKRPHLEEEEHLGTLYLDLSGIKCCHASTSRRATHRILDVPLSLHSTKVGFGFEDTTVGMKWYDFDVHGTSEATVRLSNTRFIIQGRHQLALDERRPG